MHNRLHMFTAWFLLLLLAGGYLFMALNFPVAYIWATYEDLYGEWGQTAFFGVACVMSVLLTLQRSRYRVVFAILALACFYTFMEEISWGQRLIGFETPAFFKRYNLQREANIHNLLVGPVGTSTKRTIEVAMAVILGLYGLVYPLLLYFRVGLARWADGVGIPAPPLYLAPLFLVAAWLELGPLTFNEAEVAELLVGLALVIMTLHYRAALSRGLAVHASATWPAGVSRNLAISLLAVCAAVAGAATLMTWHVYSDPAIKAQIDGRLLNGYEKFAKRYANYEDWETAAGLYLAVHEREPDRTYILRRLADAHRHMGDAAKFYYYNQKALDIALKRYARKPDSVSANLTLAYTYDQRGDTARAAGHAQRANEIALARVKARPESASSHYWLGKTYRQMGAYGKALDAYRKAHELKPSSTKYRRQYLKMQTIVSRWQGRSSPVAKDTASIGPETGTEDSPASPDEDDR